MKDILYRLSSASSANIAGIEIFNEPLRDILLDAIKEIQKLRGALEFYAEPDNYFATSFLFDPPCGAFREDFNEDRWVKFRNFNRPMPGSRARKALEDIVYYEDDHG